MPLPPLDNLTALDWLRLAESPNENALRFFSERMVDGKPMRRHLLPDELVWSMAVGMNGGLLQKALTDLSVNDILKLWEEKCPTEKQRGARLEFIYEAARNYLKVSRLSKMAVYQELVQPGLIELGRLQVDENGNPDPEQNKAAKKAYLEAMRRSSPRK